MAQRGGTNLGLLTFPPTGAPGLSPPPHQRGAELRPVPEEAHVIHLVGERSETRHVFVADRAAPVTDLR